MLSAYAGIDTLELAVFCDFASEEARHESFEWLAETQRELRLGRETQVVGWRADETLIIHRTGAAGGGGFYPYRFTWRGVDILAAPFEGEGKLPNFLVKVSAVFMLSYFGDPAKAWAELEGLLTRVFTAKVRRCCVSRADLFCDVPGVSVGTFIKVFEKNGFVRRTRRKKQIGKVSGQSVEAESSEEVVSLDGRGARWTTLALGMGGKAAVRFYDKLQELHDNQDETKRDMLRNIHWKGEQPLQLTRVEFQLRGEWLRDRGASTIQSLTAKLQGLGHYLTHSWLVVCIPGVDRRHTNRKQTHKVWEQVRTAFRERLSCGAEPPEDMTDLIPLPVGKQGIGCLASFVAKLAAGSPTFLHLVPAGPEEVLPRLHEAVTFLVGMCAKDGKSGEEVLCEVMQDRWMKETVRHVEVREAMHRRVSAVGCPPPMVGADLRHGALPPPDLVPVPASEA